MPPAACSATPVARAAAPDLLAVTGRALINGEEAGRGTGADVLGHPHHALAWLANHLAAEGRGLHAGQIVLTGSLVKTVWLKAGDHVVMELVGLGRVEAGFEIESFPPMRGPITTGRSRSPNEHCQPSHNDCLWLWVPGRART